MIHRFKECPYYENKFKICFHYEETYCIECLKIYEKYLYSSEEEHFYKHFNKVKKLKKFNNDFDEVIYE